MSTKHLSIKRLTCISPSSATIALGSELSGGIQDVRAEHILAINTKSDVRAFQRAVEKIAHLQTAVQAMYNEVLRHPFYGRWFGEFNLVLGLKGVVFEEGRVAEKEEDQEGRKSKRKK
nr:probable polygalacturonase [Ipomoea batatas]